MAVIGRVSGHDSDTVFGAGRASEHDGFDLRRGGQDVLLLLLSVGKRRFTEARGDWTIIWDPRDSLFGKYFIPS